MNMYPFAPENLVSRDGFGSSVPRQLAHVHAQAESGAYLRDSSRFPRRRPFICFKPPYAIGSVRSLVAANVTTQNQLSKIPNPGIAPKLVLAGGGEGENGVG